MNEVLSALLKKKKLNKSEKKIFEEESKLVLSTGKYDEETELILWTGPIDIAMNLLSQFLIYSEDDKADVLFEFFINSKRSSKNAVATQRMVYLLKALVSQGKINKKIINQVFIKTVKSSYRIDKKSKLNVINKISSKAIKDNLIDLIIANKSLFDLKKLDEKTWVEARRLFMEIISEKEMVFESVDGIFNWLETSKKDMGIYDKKDILNARGKNEKNVEVGKTIENESKIVEKESKTLEKKVLKDKSKTKDKIEADNKVVKVNDDKIIESKEVKVVVAKKAVKKIKKERENEMFEAIKILTATVIKENKDIIKLKSDVLYFNSKLEDIQKKLIKSNLENQQLGININNLVEEKKVLNATNRDYSNEIIQLKAIIKKIEKEANDKEEFNETINKNIIKKADENLNKLASKLKVDYLDFKDAEDLEMSIDLGENMRAQLEEVFSILKKNGINLK